MITWMQKHRKYLVVTIWISTIAFVGAGFVGWGAYDLNASRSGSVAKVGHRNISIQEFQNKYGQFHAYYSQLADGHLSEEEAANLKLENLALESLVNDALFLNFADDLGLGVNDEDIVKYIIADQNFHTNGKFDKELYKNTLKRARIPQSEYEESLKNVILLDKLRHALNIPTKKQDTDMLLASYLMQDRISMQVVEADDNEIKIDEDAVKTLWEEHKNEYKTMTEFKLDTKFIPAITSEANATELRAFYDENKNEYKGSDDKIKDFEAVRDEVLKDFNLNIAEGEHIAIMGKSGKGKTTVLNIIMGFEVPDSGFVEVTKDISTVFQENRLCEDFFAISNVCLLKKNKSLAKKILDRLGIDSAQKVKTMSGGQKRRVALARCLARNAGLYIFDEALKGLDDKTKAVAMDVIKEYTKGRSAIFVTHDINEAKEFADRIVEI